MYSGSVAPRSTTKPRGDFALFLNVPSGLVTRLDAWVDALNAEPAGPRWTRTAVICAVFLRALNERADKGDAP